MCVVDAYGVQCLAAGCRGSGAGQQGVRPGREMLHEVQHLDSPRRSLVRTAAKIPLETERSVTAEWPKRLKARVEA